MNDRELLECAAKAIDGEVFHYGECWRHPNGYEWNPLLNDGDALCLAVKLELEFYVGDDEGRKASYVSYFSIGLDRARIAVEKHEDHKDANKATRRAIVRAAAEIGKAMP